MIQKILWALLLSMPFLSVSQIEFQTHVITTMADNADAAFPVDIDGDGDLDVVSASGNDDKIAWYENLNGLGDFGPQQIVATTADNPYSAFAIDLDGDMDADILSASGQDDKIAWYENLDGAGSFSAEKIISNTTINAFHVHASDLDGDGDMDVLTASPNANKVAWHENLDGLGNFGPAQTITTSATFVQLVSTADMDNDGDLDVYSVSPNDNKIAWYENLNGLGNFGPQLVISTAGVGPSGAYAADIDGDGDLDMFASSYSDDTISWYENLNGLGSFGPQQIISTMEGIARDVHATDLDGDGDIDVLAASFLDDTISWYENLGGNGTFGPQQVISNTADAANYVFAADMDADGDMDVLSASGFDDKIAWYENLGFTVMANQPANLEQCDLDNNGVALFDLTQTEPEIIGNQNPLLVTVSFYNSLANANAGTNPISNASSYLGSDLETLFARVEKNDDGTFATTSFSLILLPAPSPITPTPLAVCDDNNDGFAFFDLTDKDVEIIGGEPNVTLTYHETLVDAQNDVFPLQSPYENIIPFSQTVYARADFTTGCFTIVPLELIVNEIPTITAVTDLVVLDEDGDGFANFDLTVKIPEIVGTQTEVVVQFFETEANAQSNENPIDPATSYQNISNPQTIYTRLTKINTNCAAVGTFNIVADPDLARIDTPLLDFSIAPIPAEGYIAFQSKEIQDVIGVVVYTVDGKKVIETQLFAENGILILDVSLLSSGLYMVQLQHEHRISPLQRFTKK